MTPTDPNPAPPESRDDEVTELLAQWRAGSETALHQLVPVLYRDLKRIARLHMKGERVGHTLDPTDLLHQAYPRLLELEVEWRDRAHFLNMASRSMRRVLVEHARARGRAKRGGDLERVTLSDDLGGSTSDDILLIDAALSDLAEVDARKSRLLEAHYFAGMTYKELAQAFDVSEATVHRELRLGKAWLGRALTT
ncbi:MAG: ECF-type sigma factor [Acidobacteriota bacterium]